MESTQNEHNAYESLEQEIEFHVTAIAVHQAAVSAAKTRINLLSPIYKLLQELMAMIFSSVKTKSHTHEVSLPQWITGISHVCRYWRDVAINSPTLWNDPPCLNAIGMAEMLARSKRIDLEIDIFFDTKRPSATHPIIKEIARHSPRIRRLSIDGLPDSSTHILEIITVPNWQLRSLRIAGVPVGGMGTISISDSLFNNTQELRRLDLSHCTFNWDLLTHRNLTQLKISYIGPHIEPTLPTLVAALGRMSVLESLTLVFAFEAPNGPASERVHLASLKVFEMTSHIPEIDHLLQSITFPTNTRVQIATSTFLEENFDIPEFVSGVTGSRSSAPDTSEYRTLVVTEKDKSTIYATTLELSLYTGVLEGGVPESMQNFSEPSHFSLTIHLDYCHDTVSPNAAGVCMALEGFVGGRLPLSKIVHVYLQSNSPNPCIDSETLVSSIGGLPAVSFIATAGGINPILISALLCRRTEPNGRTLVYFPNLTAIYLCRTGFSHNYLEENIGEFNFAMLEECLSLRAKHNAGIAKLGLEKHNSIKDHDLHTLRQFVEHVEYI